MVVGQVRTTAPRCVCPQSVVALYDNRCRRYRLRCMAGTAFEDLLHRVNNLLGTIEIQAEVAAAEGTVEAHRSALELIVDSARRTAAELAQLRARQARGE